jgi:ATP adenylyltransferase
VSLDCTFCGQIAGDPHRNAIASILDAPWAMRPVLAENDAAVVMPSIGALVPGHALVCPATHHRSVVAAPPNIAREVEDLLSTTRQRVASLTGNPTHVFEHGSSLHGFRIACSVEHAHVHIVPSAVDIRTRLIGVAKWRPAGDDLDDLRSAVGDDEYLFYAAPTGERLVATSAAGFPSQLLRCVIADAIGLADWNWRTDPATNRIRATAELLLEPLAA